MLFCVSMPLICRLGIAANAVDLAGRTRKCVLGQVNACGFTTDWRYSNCRINSNLLAQGSRSKLQEASRVPVSSHPTPPRRIPLIVARNSRALLYEETDTYVLLEPGEEEVFVNEEELRERLKAWLVKWPANELPEDLAQYGSLDEVVTYLVDSACELDLGGGLGSVQWYEVRLE